MLLSILTPLCSSLANKEDNPTYAKEMRHPDANRFIAAIQAEIQILIQMHVFEIVQQTVNIEVLLGIWAVKMKQYPNGCVNKLKSCYY